MILLRLQVEQALASAAGRRYGIEIPKVTADTPPDAALGDLAFPLPFELARRLRRPPRAIAEELAEDLRATAGVAAVQVAGAGYINVLLDRRRVLADLATGPPGASPPEPAPPRKVIVEHTNINPNKAAHIGHLRNAVLGDTLVRCLRHLGRTVEVQNYIDDTGVQVADLVVGFLDLGGPPPEEAEKSHPRFDYYCWDLYARVTALYRERPELAQRREEVLHAMEEGGNPTARLALSLADRLVRRHLATMERIDVHYDLLPRESDILRLRFWSKAFERLRERGAVHLAGEGKNTGCWVMDLAGDPEFAEIEDSQKVLVRSNGIVTYTGKDIAYQLWKFGLLGEDFGYRRHSSCAHGHTVWVTSSDGSEPGAPAFGKATLVYNVIDQRQAYPQKVVARGLAALGHVEEAARSLHFAYEMVALTPGCAAELGMELSAEDQRRPYVEMSGRRGLGVKADNLLDRLEERAREGVAARQPHLPAAEREAIAHALAVGALRYFMLRFTRNRVIAFDFGEALAFEGETGPYLQYAVVRATNILRKRDEQGPADGARSADIPARAAAWLSSDAPPPPAEEWGVVRECARLGEIVADAVGRQDLSGLARHAFTLAQEFNNFYHRFPVLAEDDPHARRRRLVIVHLFRDTLSKALELMGIPVPPRM